jgi:hypothetical protein
MRRLFAFAGLVMIVSVAPAQPPAEVKVEARYGIPGNPRLFPQTDAKAVLASAIKAAEAGRYDYLVAHLMDEKFIEGRIDDRAKLIEPSADADLRALRDRQRKDVTLDKRLQLPDDPNLFNEQVKAEARMRAFKQVLRDVEAKLTEDTTSLKELRRFLREGELISASAEAARITLRDVKDRQVFLKKAGERWFIENRQQAVETEK